MLIVAGSVVLVLRGPIGRALGRRLEGTGRADPDLVQRVEDLERRLLGAEQAEARLEEVEERLDFAERLLAREKSVPMVQRDAH